MSAPSKHKRHFPPVRFRGPVLKAYDDWFPANRSFYGSFRRWLRDGGYGDSALDIYGVAARLALGYLDKPYWLIEPDADLHRVRDYVATHYDSPGTRRLYLQGIAKLGEYLRLRCHRPAPQKRVNWSYYLGSLPNWLAHHVRTYVAHRSRSWLPENRYTATRNLVSHSTLFLRWAAAKATLTHLGDLTTALWFDYVDFRLAAGIKPITINNQLTSLHSLLQFLADQGEPVCQRTLRIKPLKVGSHLPRDVPLHQLRRLRQEIEADAASHHAGIRRMGVMDRAWFLLMLHSGLRPSEVRRLSLSHLDLQRRNVRIDQSKGLKDRIVCLSQATVEALLAYLEVRGPMATDHVFTFRHQPLSPSYCYERLRTYARRCGLHVTPRQLRHSCATLLLNAGAPILTVQTILGHKWIDTTLGYARLYDGTVAADYYRAMNQIEARMELTGSTAPDDPPLTGGQLLALVDALRAGTLNDAQRETVRALRQGILALVERETELV
jgi:integrase/recombinase XerD